MSSKPARAAGFFMRGWFARNANGRGEKKPARRPVLNQIALITWLQQRQQLAKQRSKQQQQRQQRSKQLPKRQQQRQQEQRWLRR